MTKKISNPIDNIEWVKVDELKANSYNPNVVFSRELKLLKFSILNNGWIQPILITKDNIIIDGFHRYWLSINDEEVKETFKGKVPCAILDINEIDAMLLTIRINRAKGTHIAIKMSDIIKKLVDDFGVKKEYISENIGASKGEVDLLLKDNIFKKYNPNNYEYSEAWEV